jgi:hypothetical protein
VTVDLKKLYCALRSISRERYINKIGLDRIQQHWKALDGFERLLCSSLYSRTLCTITTASAQIITATCDLVPLDADDFDPVVVDLLGLPKTTVASLIVVPVKL